MDKEKNKSSIISGMFRSLYVYVISILIAFGIISIILALLHFNVAQALKILVTTSFSSSFGFQETVKKAIPLLFTTYAFTIPFAIKFFNIGGYGQMVFGGTLVAVVGLSLANFNFPSVAMIPILIVVGLVAGGALALIAGFLKAKYDVNPIISTIMLNFVADYFLNFIATSKVFRDPLEGHPITKYLPSSARLGFLGGIPYSIFFAIAAIVFVYLLLKRSKTGYEITAVGYNPIASRVFGVNFPKTIMITFFVAGALAGLGGALEVMNIHGRLIEGFAKTSGAQFGIFGILTSLVVGGNPLSVPIASFLMSVLLVGADTLQVIMQIPVEMVFLTQSIIVLMIVVIRQRLTQNRR
ncbi:MAG: ABC transporter permease [Candidatus Atribacteria bacterium]|nr:ABC transporter permease [Candidatus Atribacteria bacterium]